MLPDTITYRTPGDEPDADTLSLAAVRDTRSPRRTATAGAFAGPDSPEARAGHESWTGRGSTPPPGHDEDARPPQTKGPLSRRHARRRRGQEQGPDVSRSAAPWGTVE